MAIKILLLDTILYSYTSHKVRLHIFYIPKPVKPKKQVCPDQNNIGPKDHRML